MTSSPQSKISFTHALVVSSLHFTFFSRDPKLVPLFERLQKEEKKIFLITNSPFETVDAGMTFMMGSQWRDFFDVVVVQVDP